MKVRRRVLFGVDVNLQSVDLLNESTAIEENPPTVRLGPNITARIQETLKVRRQILNVLDSR
jgi:hypothetical protein